MGSEDLPPQLEKQSSVHIRTLPSLACPVRVIILFTQEDEGTSWQETKISMGIIDCE